MINTNKLIEDESYQTLSNVHTVVEFLREFHHEQQFSKSETSINSHVATALLLELIGDALSYENGRVETMEQRLKSHT